MTILNVYFEKCTFAWGIWNIDLYGAACIENKRQKSDKSASTPH